MIKISQLFKSIPSQKRIPQKTVIITSKNGKDAVTDEFVGYRVQNSGLVDLFRNLYSNFANFFDR